MISSAFTFHLVSGLVIIVLLIVLVRLNSRLLFVRTLFQQVRMSDGGLKRRIFVNDLPVFLKSFCTAFELEFFAEKMRCELRKIDVTTLLRCHELFQLAEISMADCSTLLLTLHQLPTPEEKRDLGERLKQELKLSQVEFKKTDSRPELKNSKKYKI